MTQAKRFINTGEKTVLLAQGILLLSKANSISWGDDRFAKAEKAYATWCNKHPELRQLAIQYQSRMFDSLIS